MVTLKEWIRRLTERLSLSFLAVIVLGWFIYTCITRWRKRNDHLLPRSGDPLSPDESTTVTPVSPPADSGGASGLSPGIHNSCHHNHANGDARRAGANSSATANGNGRQDTSTRSTSSRGVTASSSRSTGANRSHHRHSNGAPRSSTTRHSASVSRQRRLPIVADDAAATSTTTTAVAAMTASAESRREDWRRTVDTSDDMTIDAGTPPPSYESVCDDPPSYNQVFTEAKK